MIFQDICTCYKYDKNTCVFNWCHCQQHCSFYCGLLHLSMKEILHFHQRRVKIKMSFPPIQAHESFDGTCNCVSSPLYPPSHMIFPAPVRRLSVRDGRWPVSDRARVSWKSMFVLFTDPLPPLCPAHRPGLQASGASLRCLGRGERAGGPEPSTWRPEGPWSSCLHLRERGAGPSAAWWPSKVEQEAPCPESRISI